MKKYLLFLFLLPLLSTESSAQTLRKCGCQPWRQWKNEAKVVEGTRREKRQKYAKYKEECLAACRKTGTQDRKPKGKNIK